MDEKSDYGCEEYEDVKVVANEHGQPSATIIANRWASSKSTGVAAGP